MIDQGISLCQISMKINRGKNSVVVEVRRNGGKEKYDPIIAQKAAIDRRKEGYKKISQLRSKNPDHAYPKIRMRLDNLEMQLEILCETIQELIRERDTKNNGL